MKASRMSGLLDHQPWRLDRDRGPAAPLAWLDSLLRLLVVRTQQLLQIRRKLSFCQATPKTAPAGETYSRTHSAGRGLRFHGSHRFFASTLRKVPFMRAWSFSTDAAAVTQDRYGRHRKDCEPAGQEDGHAHQEVEESVHQGPFPVAFSHDAGQLPVIIKVTNSISAELFFRHLADAYERRPVLYSNSFSSCGCRFSCHLQKA